jgi:AcrR family transcriptional regulator
MATKRRGESVVERVLEVTLDELARVGMERLSVPAVARRAGLNKTSVYRRWPTREALVQAAIERSMRESTTPPDTGSLTGDLAALAVSVAKFLQTPRSMGLLRLLFEQRDARERAALQARLWDGPVDGPRLVVQRAIARGELRADVDAELLLFTVAGAVIHRLFVEGRPADAPWARRLVTLLAEGTGPRRVGSARGS